MTFKLKASQATKVESKELNVKINIYKALILKNIWKWEQYNLTFASISHKKLWKYENIYIDFFNGSSRWLEYVQKCILIQTNIIVSSIFHEPNIRDLSKSILT